MFAFKDKKTSEQAEQICRLTISEILHNASLQEMNASRLSWIVVELSSKGTTSGQAKPGQAISFFL